MIGTDCSPSFVGASGYESGNRAAALLRRLRSGGALALLALAVLALAVPSKAQADVLVSNFNQLASDGGYVGNQFRLSGTDDLAQGFTTGTNTGGYTLTSIEIPFTGSISTADIGDLTVSVHADDGSGNPAATALFALDKPASVPRTNSSGTNPITDIDNWMVTGPYAAFTVPAGTTATLSMMTSYFVVLTYDSNGTVWSATADAEDTGAAAGWSIADASRHKPGGGSWTVPGAGRSLLIRVNGTAAGGTVTNDPPTAANKTVTTAVNDPYAFEADDFNFMDTDAGDSLASVKIVTLPAVGTLALDGTAVVVDQVVTKADIDASELTFTPAMDASGDAYASFTFKVNDGTVDSAAAYTMTVNVTPAPTAPVVVVDGVNVTSMAASDDTYGTGEKIEFTVTFDQAVTVTGTPEFEFCLGSTATVSCSDGTPPPALRSAAFESGSGTTMLVFSYTVLEGDVDDNGIWIGDQDSTIKLGTATIQGTVGGLDAVLTHAEVGSDGHKVNGQANAAPTAANNTVTTRENRAYAFTAADFGFTDTDAGDTLASVRIVTLPAAGALELGGGEVVADQVVTRAKIDLVSNGGLTFTPAVDANGDAYASFTFKVNDGTVDSASAYTMTVNVTAAPPPNNPVTGLPVISGTAEVGQVLTVATDAIADADGLGTFSHHWVRVDADGVSNFSYIGADAATYTLVDDDLGKRLRVLVTFIDGAGKMEYALSRLTHTVVASGTSRVTLVLSPVSISEDGGMSTVTAVLDRPSSAATVVQVSAAPVTPAVAADFSLSGTTLTIAAGQTESTGAVTISAVNNDVGSADKTVTVSGVATNADGVTELQAVDLTIVDDDQPSTEVTLTVSPGSISEGATGTAVTVTAVLNRAVEQTATAVAMTVTAGTATQGEDFAPVSDFTVTIPIGERSGAHTFTLTPLEDVIDEPDETVRLTGRLSGSGLSLVQPPGGLTVTIEDNEPEPKATLVLTPDSIREDGGETTVTATLDIASPEVTTIAVTATPVAPAVAGDFRLIGTTLTIPPGATESTDTVTIEAVDNDVEAPNKRVTVSATAQNAFGVEDPPDRTLTITDNEIPSRTVTLSVSPSDIREGVSRTVTVTAELDGAARTGETQIAISVGPGTAAATDFEVVAGFTLTIPAEAKSGSADFTLNTVQDETDEPDETVVVRGRTPGLTVAPSAGVTVTIVDDDPEPVVTLELTPASISENGGSSTVTAELDRPSSQSTTVTVSAAAQTPAVAGDFRLRGNTTLTIAAGQTESAGTVRITAVNNDVESADKTVTVSGVATNADGVTGPQAVDLTIADDEQPSTEVTLTVSPDNISEGATGNARRVTVTAALNRAARETVTAVAMTVTAGTATQGEDFVAVSDFTVTIPIGQRSGSATFTLMPLDDVIDEPDETVRLTGRLSGSGLTLQPSGGLTLTIEDNEPEPKVTLVLTPDSIREDDGETTVTATLDSPSTEETTITVTATPVAPAVAGDFRLIGTTLTIPPGETESTGTVTIEAVGNEVEAPNKRVTVSATAQNDFGVGDPPDRTLTITDNEFPSRTVTLSVLPDSVPEDATGPARTVTVTAELDGAARTADTAVMITVGTGTAAAADFTPVTGFTLTIVAGDKNGSAAFTLAPVDDQTDEPDETVVVRGRTSGLTVAPSGGVTVTIADDDDPPEAMLVLTPPSISENGGSSTVTAELDHPSSAQTVVTVTATAQNPAVAGDFRLSGTRLTIPAGQTVSTGRVTLSGVNNELTAQSKRVTVSGAAENAQGIVQPQPVDLTITDDDQPSEMVVLTVTPDTVSENGGAKRLTVTGMLDGAPESADTVVTLRVNAGAAEAVEAVLTIPTGRRSATAVLILTPVDNAIDAADAVVTVVASINNSSLTLDPSSLEVTVTDDDERGVTVSATALTVREGPDGGATYTVVLGSQPTLTVTVTPSVPSQPPGTNLSVSPQRLDFTASNWNEPQTVTVTAADDGDVEEDAVVEVTHMVSGGDYGSNDVAAAAVTVTVPGYEESADGTTVELKVPAGDPVVSVPEGTSMPELAGIEVTLPSGTETVAIRMVDDSHVALRDPPQGFRAGDLVVDIEPRPALSGGQTAQVCLPASSGSQRVHRYDEDATPPEWVELEVPAGGSPQGLACGVTDHFTLFALGSAPGEMAVNSWLSRFGRTVAEQVVDMVTERLQSPREAGTLATLAGHGFGHPVVPPVLDGLPSGTGAARDGDREGWSRSLTGRELLTGMSFTMTGGETAAGSVAVWGRVAHTRFDGRDGAASVDGEVTTMALGMDRASGPWTWGVSLARSEGRGTHGLDDSSNRLRTSLTGLYPFVGYKAGDRLSLWGVAGYGEGDLELTLEGGEPQTTGLKLAMAATGARGELASGGDGFLLSLETDGLFVRTSSGDTADLAASEADASRLRLGLDASWALATESGGRLRPAFEVGLRHDGGDAETGMGVDIGGGIEWADPALGLAVDLHAHGLLAHEAGGFAERGVSGSVLWDRDRSSERGLEATLSQSLGASGRAGDLLERRTMAGLGQADDGGSTGRLDAKLGYGLAVFGNRFTGTPWIGVGLSGSARDYTLGWRFRPSGGTSLDLGLEASRRETANDNGPEHGIGLRLTARW